MNKTGRDTSLPPHGDKPISDVHDHHLRPKLDQPAEWWYYNGHLASGENRYSFHVAFFRFSTDDYRIGRFIPLRAFTGAVAVAHASLIDHRAGTTQFGHRRDMLFSPSKLLVRQKTADFDFRLGQWSIMGNQYEHHIQFQLGDAELDLDLSPAKPVVSYHAHSFQPPLSRASTHCSSPRLNVSGSIRKGSQSREVQGISWLDREHGAIGPDHEVAGWMWLSIQLNNGTEMMFYRVLKRGTDVPSLKFILIDQESQLISIDADSIETIPLRSWISPRTGVEYDLGWKIQLHDHQITLTLDAIVDDLEFDTPGSTHARYWEGPMKVTGRVEDAAVSGHAYMERLGESVIPGRRTIDHAKKNLSLAGYLQNELQFRTQRKDELRLCQVERDR